MEILIGMILLIGVLVALGGQARHDAQELGPGCTAGLLLIFGIVLFVTLAVFGAGAQLAELAQ